MNHLLNYVLRPPSFLSSGLNSYRKGEKLLGFNRLNQKNVRDHHMSGHSFVDALFKFVLV